MGKLICESTTRSSGGAVWKDPTLCNNCTNIIPEAIGMKSCWENVPNLDKMQVSQLTKLESRGVVWKNKSSGKSVVFMLSHGGEVAADGNCLFTAIEKVTGEGGLRKRAVKRFLESGFGEGEREQVDRVIKNMYSGNVSEGWGVHVVQEVKMLAKKEERDRLDEAIDDLVQFGMIRELAAESIYKERCIAVDDGPSWAKYMSISGSPDDEYDIISLQYTEEGLLTVDDNRDGHAAAFGDDIAIECLATEFRREIYVVQAHGSDAMLDDEDSCVFFLPHAPRSDIIETPLFLFMKGTGWCGAGGDHYEPLIAQPSSANFPEKVAFVL